MDPSNLRGTSRSPGMKSRKVWVDWVTTNEGGGQQDKLKWKKKTNSIRSQ